MSNNRFTLYSNNVNNSTSLSNLNTIGFNPIGNITPLGAFALNNANNPIFSDSQRRGFQQTAIDQSQFNNPMDAFNYQHELNMANILSTLKK